MTFFHRKIDIHHIFPQKWCKNQKIDRKIFDSIVNKTPLSKESNIEIGGDAPSVYLKRIETKTGMSPAALDCVLRTHLIDVELLRANDFHGFFNARIKALSTLISSAIGKPVVEDHSSNVHETEVDDDDDVDEVLDELDTDE